MVLGRARLQSCRQGPHECWASAPEERGSAHWVLFVRRVLGISKTGKGTTSVMPPRCKIGKRLSPHRLAAAAKAAAFISPGRKPRVKRTTSASPAGTPPLCPPAAKAKDASYQGIALAMPYRNREKAGGFSRRLLNPPVTLPPNTSAAEAPWKSGASAPRKSAQNKQGFSPRVPEGRHHSAPPAAKAKDASY